MQESRKKNALPHMFRDFMIRSPCPRKQGGIYSLDLERRGHAKLLTPAKHVIKRIGCEERKLSNILNSTFHSTRYSSASKDEKIQSMSFTQTHGDFPIQTSQKAFIQARGRTPVDRDSFEKFDSLQMEVRKMEK